MKVVMLRFTVTGLMIAVLLLCGCSSSTQPDFVMPVKISAAFDPPDLSASKVVRVELTVSAEDIGTSTIEVPIVNGKVEHEFEVKPGRNRLIQLDAYDADSVLLYSGQETVNVGLGENVSVTVKMTPQVLMIKVDPIYQKVDPFEEILNSFRIYVYNVEDLFGVSCRIYYDPNVIVPLSTQFANEFLGDDLISYPHYDSNYVALTSVRKRGAGVVDGSGLIATIAFDPVNEGTTTREIDSSKVVLSGATGFPIDGSTSLVIENGTIVVEQNQGGQ
jgi:hypothetical protein